MAVMGLVQRFTSLTMIERFLFIYWCQVSEMWLHPQPAGVYKDKEHKVTFCQSSRGKTSFCLQNQKQQLSLGPMTFHKQQSLSGRRLQENGFLKHVCLPGRELEWGRGHGVWKESSAVRSTCCHVRQPELGSPQVSWLTTVCKSSSGP